MLNLKEIPSVERRVGMILVAVLGNCLCDCTTFLLSMKTKQLWRQGFPGVEQLQLRHFLADKAICQGVLEGTVASRKAFAFSNSKTKDLKKE